MATGFANASTGLLAAVDSMAGESVDLLWRGSTLPLVMVPGKTEHDTIGADNMPVLISSSDWMLPAADIAFESAGPILPREGMVIEHTVDDVVRRYRVRKFNGKAYRFCDESKTRVRIYTQRVKDGETT